MPVLKRARLALSALVLGAICAPALSASAEDIVPDAVTAQNIATAVFKTYMGDAEFDRILAQGYQPKAAAQGDAWDVWLRRPPVHLGADAPYEVRLARHDGRILVVGILNSSWSADSPWLLIPPGPNWSPDAPIVAKMEGQMQMPPLRTRHNVSEYQRRYIPVLFNGRHMIYGELDYWAGTPGWTPGIEILSDGHFVHITGDGGCATVYSVYHADAGMLESLDCAGSHNLAEARGRAAGQR